MDPRDPTRIKTFLNKEDPNSIKHDQTKVDHLFKTLSMQRRINAATAGPRQRNRWQATAAQEIGWYAEPLVPKNKI